MTFSLIYKIDDEYEYAIDWCGEERGWGESSRYTLEWTRKWTDSGSLSYSGYKALLEMFKLKEKDFPVEKLERMSPSQLARITGTNMQSDTLGDHRPALEVETI